MHASHSSGKAAEKGKSLGGPGMAAQNFFARERLRNKPAALVGLVLSYETLRHHPLTSPCALTRFLRQCTESTGGERGGSPPPTSGSSTMKDGNWEP